MKKILLLFLSVSLFLPGKIFSQISLTSSDIILPGFTFYYGVDNAPGGSVTIGGTGNQTWNFSSLTATAEDTLISLLPSVTPYVSSFPGANLCIRLGSTDNYYYYSNGTDSIVSPGDALNDYFNGAVIRTFTPPQEVLNFPATFPYNKNYTTFRYGKFPYPGAVIDSLEEKKIKTIDLGIDAYGSMVTSLGTYQVLRVKEIILSNDSIFKHDPWGGWQFMNDARDTIVTYSWWAKNLGQPVAIAYCNYAGTIQTVKWLKSQPVYTGINNSYTHSNDITIFPSPANEKLRVKAGTAIKQISIYNNEGKLCDRIVMNEDFITQKEFDVNHLQPGIYFVSVIQKNNFVSNKKIIVAR